jgi:hypothetical protein
MIDEDFVARLLRGEVFLLGRVTADRMDAQQKVFMRGSEIIS